MISPDRQPPGPAHRLPMIDRQLLRRCVHCGLCLPTCPTYDILGDERDSPRGRLFQMKAAIDGKIPLTDPQLNRHLSRCLDCRACETACPSGVQYGRILEEVRAALPQPTGMAGALGAFVLDEVFTRPPLLDVLGASMRLVQSTGLLRLTRRTGIVRLLPAALQSMEALLPEFQPLHPLPAFMPASGVRRARVGLVTGCVMKQAFGATTAATARVLVANGCDVVIPRPQGCCGALHSHAGHPETARHLARRLIDSFPSGLDAVIINAAGCGSALKEYGHLLRADSAYAARAVDFAGRVRDVSEWVDVIGLIPPTHAVSVRLTYQDACHLRHAQRIAAAPRRLLAAIPGVDIVEMTGAAECCGSAGIYNLTHPALARQLAEKKMDRIAATEVRMLVVGNPGCAIQIKAAARQRGYRLHVTHPVDLLDRAYRS